MFEGCPAEDSSVPFETKEFNISEYLDADRAEDFVGRQWLFREVEDAFEEENIAGVQIIGSPAGSGKSALASQLICSRTSSSFIHGRILGYHVCKYSDQNTQMAGKFVRNLAEMIGRRLPEYGYIVSNTTYIQRSLKDDCMHHQDPVGCFEVAVLSPLRNLKNKPRKNWFVVVDALDECLTQGETGHSIVFLLNNKIQRFPPWLKVVMTSRNESYASLHSSKVKKITIDPDDSRNLKDLEIFVTKRLFQEGPLLQRITWWFGDDSVKSITKLATQVLSTSQGNFLFVTELLKDWENSRHVQELRNAYVLPKTLRDLFHSYFERLYPRKGSFRPVRHILELLVSTFEPLTQNQMFDLLKIREKSLDEYDFKNRLRELGHFLKIGKDNTLTLYHLSLTEWLTSEENEKYFVSKEKGHEAFCDYYFGVVRDRKKNRPRDYILALAQHIVLGGSKEAHVQEFLSLPSQTINSSDPQNNRTLLHSAATIDNRDALELLLRHFSRIDCVDDRGITPAFLAAERGFVDNLVLLVKKGAKINHKTKTMVSFYKANFLTYLRNVDIKLIDYYKPLSIPNAIAESKSKYFDSSMLHAAAQRGRASVVRFLIQNNTNLSLLNGVQLTAIQIAAEKGHLEIVKSLYEAGAVADQTALHHAAANNRLEVVNYLLDIGVKDKCLRCDGSFYWVEGGKHRLTDGILFLRPPKKEYCSLWENTWPDENKTLFDDKHLILCHSALHAAVSSGHDKVVTRLLSEKHNALNCHDYSGKTPLHEAVRRNNTIIVNSLLEKQSRMIHNKCKHWQKLDEKNESMEYNYEYYDEHCTCGYTPLHVAASYGLHQLAALLIRKGARVDDRDCSGTTPLHIAALNGLADTVNVLLQANAVTIECGKPFIYSLFHLLSYLSSTFEENNFFFSESCSETTDPRCTVKKGPLAKAIESHPEKQLIISSCFDAEGFTCYTEQHKGSI